MLYGLHLPALNACLNAASAACLVLGFYFIRRGNQTAHRKAMLAACGTSTLFLISYLYYHFHHGSTSFTGDGIVRKVYFTVLISHTVLAVAVVPLAIVTLLRGLKGQFERHAKVARLCFPVWLYVSVTGVVVYWMLYRMG